MSFKLENKTSIVSCSTFQRDSADRESNQNQILVQSTVYEEIKNILEYIDQSLTSNDELVDR